ncbi:hypothetical protein [Rouxiella sp. WC2420]|uniref:Uncharacterized protein n=1 Tax=Rouxiella sp. WC2420 TaxID=3234145 RepID=A0AB39VMK8_9GAMM
MTDHHSLRLKAITPITPAHAEAVLPTVLDWAERASALSDFVNANIGPEVAPITVFISPAVKTS